jgi:hypothetical protein
VPEVGPAAVLALVVATFHVGVYLLLRGTASLILPIVWLAAFLGAFGGQALALRLGDPLAIGDFGLAWSSVLAWLGIVLVTAVDQLSPSRDRQ